MARDDDAREIPQRRPSRHPDPAAGRPSDDDFDDAFVVDTRGRSRRPGSEPRRTPAPRLDTGAGRGSAAERRRPARDDAMPRTRVMPVVPRAVEDDEDGFGGSGGPQRPVSAPGRRRPRIRRWLALVLLLLVAWAGFTVYAPMHAWGGVDRVDDSPSGDRPSDGDGHDYLLVGSDSREGLTAQEIKNLGTGGVKGNEGRRTDSIILVHVPGGGGKKVMVSIPRDSDGPIPGHGASKINAAFSYGGPKLLVETVERATGVRIDGYLEIGFGGFAKLVDSMGGVDICVPFDMNDPKAHINLKKGCQTLDGKNALGFVRARYSDPRGDIGRAQRQRQFLGAIMHEMATPSTVLIPTRWWPTAHNAVAGLRVGEDTSVWDAYRIVSAMRGVSSQDTLSLVVPIQDTNYQTNAGSSVKWDSPRARELFTMLARDTPITTPPPGTDGKPSNGR
jgi:LCP family protein required for cell wall assembly